MARKPTGNPVGRPKKPIDWDQFEQLCALQCIQSEIASFFHTNIETIRTRVEAEYGADYLEIYKRFAESGKCSLRRNQFVISKKNASMAIWLGKIWLGQRDPNCEETKDILENARQAIRDIQNERRMGLIGRSVVEDQQPLLDQELRRQADQIRIELGAENPVGGNA